MVGQWYRKDEGTWKRSINMNKRNTSLECSEQVLSYKMPPTVTNFQIGKPSPMSCCCWLLRIYPPYVMSALSPYVSSLSPGVEITFVCPPLTTLVAIIPPNTLDTCRPRSNQQVQHTSSLFIQSSIQVYRYIDKINYIKERAARKWECKRRREDELKKSVVSLYGVIYKMRAGR